MGEVSSSSRLQTNFNPQPDSKFYSLPHELQLTIFEQLSAIELMRVACICKDWNLLANDSRLWKKIACPLLGQISAINEKLRLLEQDPDWKKLALDRMRDPFFPIYFQLKLEENLGPEIFEKIKELEVWQEDIEFHEEFSILNLALQTQEDDKNHFFKKVVNGELILIFITEGRFCSKMYRFYPSFNPNSFEKDEHLYIVYREDGHSQIYLSKRETKQNRDYALSLYWETLKMELNFLFVHKSWKIETVTEDYKI